MLSGRYTNLKVDVSGCIHLGRRIIRLRLKLDTNRPKPDKRKISIGSGHPAYRRDPGKRASLPNIKVTRF